MNKWKRIVAVAAITLVGVLAAPAIATADEIPPPGKSAVWENVFYDKEGTPYVCKADPDPKLGCLYHVDEHDGGFTLYFIGNDGSRYNFFIKAMSRGWVHGYEWFSEPHPQHWKIWAQDAPYHTVFVYEFESDNAQNYIADPSACDCPDGVC